MDLLADLRYALRLLRKTPVFTIAAIGTLALGIGANTTIFSLVQTILLRPLPYQDPDQVVMVWEDNTPAGFPRNTPAPGNFNDWRANSRSFTDMAATRFAFASLTMDGPPDLVLGRGVSPNFFDVLGVRPTMGRSFTPADDRIGVNVVIISHALWQRRYGGDPAIVGRTILMSDVKYEIVGIAPRSFVFLSREVEYWVPIQLATADADSRRGHFLNVVARLKPGVSVQAADTEMRVLAKRLEKEHPETNRDVGAVVVPIREQVLGDTRVEVVALAIAAMAIVLIACANLASLLLARASVRGGEYAIRLSLGATRGRLARQVLIEALCLSVAGGALGLTIPILTSTLIERIVPVGLQGLNVSVLDWRLLAFAGVLSIVTGVLFSLGPAVQSAHASTADVLQQHARGIVGGPARRFRDALVVLQVAATLVLLVGAGLMLRTLANLNAVELNFDPNNLLTMQVALPQTRYPDAAMRLAFYDRVVREVRALPGVQGAAFGSTLPFQATGNTRFFAVEGRQLLPGDVPDALFRVGTGDYLRTLGVRPTEGRLIDERDSADAPPAVVVNETLARRFLAGGPALGRRIRFGPKEPSYTVVGVVRNVLERGYEQEEKPGVYLSAAQASGFGSNLVVRVTGDPTSYAPAVQRIIQQVDPDQPTRLVRSMNEIINLSVGDRRQHTVLLVMFGGLAMLIAALGLYGLLAQTVSARGREIGIRIALGATWKSVIAMVMSRGMALTVTGLAVGALIAWAVTRAMSALLYRVDAGDPFTFAAVAGLLGGVSIAACAIPAIRASRVDPMLVLRDQ
ncbi:MAG TPA: ABC transporter permease [Vicinamibacterales bacterium]|nr:ABC transporter permease [Vicinamibacterales bacterium]